VLVSLVAGWVLAFLAVAVGDARGLPLEGPLMLPVVAVALLQGLVLHAVLAEGALARLLAPAGRPPGADAPLLRAVSVLSLVAAALLLAVAFWPA
jgi:hypothetical protein